MNVFSILGLTFDGIGTALLVAGLAAGGEARWALITVGLSLMVPGVALWLLGRKLGPTVTAGSKILREGVAARGVVLSVAETGVTINSSPAFAFEVEVQPSGAAAYPARVKQVVPRPMVGAASPGTEVALKVDPGNPASIAIDWTRVPQPAAAAPVDAAELARRVAPEGRASAADLLTRGRRGTATVVAARDAGRAGDLGLVPADDARAADPVLLFELEIKLPGRDPYTAEVLHIMPARLAGLVGPGRELEVAVDRDDPEHQVAVDWEAEPA